MAARTRKTELDANWRANIRTTMLLQRLENHGLGQNKMTNSQIRAAEVVLRKTVPDLARTEHTGKDGGPVQLVTNQADVDLL